MKINYLLSLILSVSLIFLSCRNDNVEPGSGNKMAKKGSSLSSKAIVGSRVSQYGTFTVQNTSGGLFMEVSGNPAYNEKYINGAKTTQWAATSAGDLWQKWQTQYRKTENGVAYYSLMNLHSGKYLDVPSSSAAVGLQLQQWEYNGSNAQLFEFREVEGGYAIINRGNGLAVTNQNSSTSNGTPIVQQTLGSGTTGNLAHNKTVTVPSAESTDHPGQFAVDGNGSTRWSSQYSDPQWLYVDLGTSYNINRVKITWETALGKDYQIQISNNASSWTTIRTVTGNTTLVNDLTGLSGTARYVRMYGTARGTMWGYSIFEMEVYGTGNTVPSNQTWILTALAADSYRDDAVTRYFQRNNSSLGSVAWDQGSSIPLSWGSNNGKVLWVTQDAWDGSKLQSNNMFRCSDFFDYNNSIIIQQNKNDWTPDDPNMTINSPMGRPKQICSNQPGTDWSWPSNGVEIGDKVYMHCGEGVGLGLTNQSIYVLTQNSGTLWSVQRTTPAGMSGQTDINYASGMVKRNDGYVYAFGTRGTGFGYSSDIHVARFPVSNPMSWSFWNGSGWTSSPTSGTAARIADAKATAAITYVNGKYVMITMDQGFNCDNTRNIYAATSTSPTGPFSAPVQVYKINDFFGGQYTRYYTPNVHPEFDNGHNELLITYSVNFSACGVNDCSNGYLDPNYYRIRGVRVPYAKMGM
ncbi:MAG TPA: discoidin domain-containing protein [Cytophagales bacterium]|nr:discoidin domain-containing protein [Cytophagales bacterium]